MTTIASYLSYPVPEIDILLAHVLSKARSFIYAYPEYVLTEKEQYTFKQLLEKRMQGAPIAYLTGHREFWSLDLRVSEDTLIPRPETELLVELALKNPSSHLTVADLGTGSGAIALALASERPDWLLHATDTSAAALAVAADNALRLQLTNIQFYEGFWEKALAQNRYDMILSNPPYIAEGDPHLEQNVLKYEPHRALIAGEEGFSDLRHIIKQAIPHLTSGGKLILEHGFTQAASIRRFLAKLGYTQIKTECDLAGLERVTMASFYL